MQQMILTRCNRGVDLKHEQELDPVKSEHFHSQQTQRNHLDIMVGTPPSPHSCPRAPISGEISTDLYCASWYDIEKGVFFQVSCHC